MFFRSIFAFALLVTSVSAQQIDESKIREWIGELSSDHHIIRANASQLLSKHALPWRSLIEDATLNSEPETRLRAEEILTEIKRQNLWLPTMVQLPTGPQDAERLLDSIEGVQIGDEFTADAKFQNKSIEVASGAWWKVLDDICVKSGNTHRSHYQSPYKRIVCIGSPMSPVVVYEGPFRLCINSIERKYIRTKDFGLGDQKTDSLNISAELSWEPKFTLLGAASTPNATGKSLDGRELRSNRIYSQTNSYTKHKSMATSISIAPPALNQDKIDLIVKWSIFGCGEFIEKEISRKDATPLTKVYEVELRSIVLENKNITVEWALSSPLSDANMIQEATLSIEIDGKRIKSAGEDVTNEGTYCRLNKTRFPAPLPDGNINKELEKQILENAKLFVTVPSILDRKEVVFLFKDVPLPKVD